MDIRGALSRLDQKVDSHWTTDGLPAVEAVKQLSPAFKNVTRGQITAAAPAFTRFNTGLDPDGEDAPEGALPEPTGSETSFSMESSEFGGSAPLGSETPPPPAPEPSPDEAKAALEAANEALALAQKAATAAKAAEAAANRLRDEALSRLERERTPQEKQQVLMGYLNSVAPSKREGEQRKQVEMSPLDKAHVPATGYGKGLPNYPTR